MPANLENPAVGRTGKGQFSFQSQRKAMSKNVQTATQLHSSHTSWQSNSKNSPSQASTVHELRTFRCSIWISKGRGTRGQIANIHWIIEKVREFQKNIYFCFINYPQSLWLCGKFFKRWEYQTNLPASWEICVQVMKQQLEPDMKEQTSSKSGRKYVKVVYFHSAYWTYLQSTSCEMPGWMKHKLESRLPRETSITSDRQMMPLLCRK